MTELDKEVNNLIMQEIGLEVGRDQRIYDQDTGSSIRINGMDVIAPGCYAGHKAVEFDPHNNRKMMNQLFGYFLNKYSDETDIDVLSYYNVNTLDGEKIECKMSDNSTIRSKPYKRDSLKYTDIIMQLNGDNSEDLNKYDQIPNTKTVKGRTKRGVSSNGNKTNRKTAKNS